MVEKILIFYVAVRIIYRRTFYQFKNCEFPLTLGIEKMIFISFNLSSIIMNASNKSIFYKLLNMYSLTDAVSQECLNWLTKAG